MLFSFYITGKSDPKAVNNDSMNAMNVAFFLVQHHF